MSTTPTTPGLALARPGDLPALAPDPRRYALSVDPFEPQTLAELYNFAERVAMTEFAPQGFRGKPNDCFIAMVYGRGLGVSSLQALQGIAVINGRPSAFGTLYWAIVTSHPDFEDCEEEVDETAAVVKLTRKGRSPKVATFTMDDAAKAGLKGKAGPWTQYPKGQMLWRARHQAADALFADALKGIAPREVTYDYIDAATLTPQNPEREALPTVAASPAPAAKGDFPKPAEASKDEGSARVVNDEETKQWNAALTAAGFKAADKRAELTRVGVTRVGEMTLAQFTESMAHCKNGPVAATKEEPKPTEQAASSVEPDTEPDETEKTVRGWMNALEMSMFAVDALVKKYTKDDAVDWGGIGLSLEQEMKDRGIA